MAEIELPETKEYHLFFGYATSDGERMKNIVKKLEKSPYNIKCAYGQRDFMPGCDNINEIDRCILKSMKTVLLITPAFLESCWCNTELSKAHDLRIRGLANMVPVKLENCEIPVSINYMSYLDAVHMNDEELVKKIWQSLKQNPDDLSGYLREAVAINGSHFSIHGKYNMGITYSLKGIIHRRWDAIQFQREDELKEGLEQRKIEMSGDTLREIMDNIQQYYGKLNTMLATILVFILIILGFYSNALLFMLMFLGYLYKAYMYHQRICCRMLSKHSISLGHKHKVLLNINFTVDSIVLNIMKYDLKPCLEHWQQRITQRGNLLATNKNVLKMIVLSINAKLYGKKHQDEPLLAYLNEECLDTTQVHLHGYMNDLINNQLENAITNRHPVIHGKQCFCQYIEKKILQKRH
ncbi:unnamed protein product [Owenia fusiformis]|uniref:Uncharacterized protein n=1 Tax=Owenia fusiformis TaxID=6347 RepID=A0A8J1U8X1_OWEFU|nr:unnamed protein product [Owenia fusiformis]